MTQGDTSIELKFILGLLNSKLIYFWLYNRGKRKGEMLELYLTPLSEIPIKKPSSQISVLIITLVNEIIQRKQSSFDDDTSALEKDIDIIIFKLYELDFYDIKIIDPEISLTEEEYNNYEI